MDISGKIIQFLQVQSGQGKNGTWKKQEFILETGDNYPKKVCIAVWGDKIDMGSFKTGERLVNNPGHTANGSIFYSFGGRLEGFKIGTTIVYLGNRYAGWNTDVLTTGPVTYRDRLIPVSGYTTVDLSAGYTFRKKIAVMAKVSNLTNTYNVNVHENYSVNPIPPTQFSATVSYKF